MIHGPTKIAMEHVEATGSSFVEGDLGKWALWVQGCTHLFDTKEAAQAAKDHALA